MKNPKKIEPSTLSLINRMNDPVRLEPLSDDELILLMARMDDISEVLSAQNFASFGFVSFAYRAQQMADARDLGARLR